MSESSLLQYLIRGGIWAFAGKLVSGIMGFLLFAILARILTPDDMAIFFLSNSIALFLSLTGRFGLDNTLLRLISESLASENNIRAKSLLIKGISLVGVISTGLAIFVYFGPGLWLLSLLLPTHQFDNIIGFITIWSITLSFQFLLGEIFRAFKNINLSVFFGGILTAVLSVVILTILWFFDNINDIATVFLMIVIIGTINLIAGITILYIRLNKVAVSEVKKSELLHNSWSFWLNAMTHYILSFSGLWIIGIYGTSINVANYGAANRLIILVGMSLVIVNSVVPPIIARLNVKERHEQLETVLRSTATIAAIPAITIIIILLIFAEQAMSLIFGVLYESGAAILRILLIAQIIGVLSGSCGYLLMMTGHQKIMMNISMVAAIASVTLGLLVFGEYGVVGIAWVTTIMIVIQQVITVIFAHKMTGVWSHFSLKHLNQFFINGIFFSKLRK